MEVRSYGPWASGFVNSVPPHAAPKDAITRDASNDSYDWLIDPSEGSLVRRKGSSSLTANCMESLAFSGNPRAKKLFSMTSPSLVSDAGYSTIAGLFGVESEKKGAIWMRNAGAALSNYVIGAEFTAGTNYPTPNGSAVGKTALKIIPLWSELTTVTSSVMAGIHRLKTADARARLAGGARGVIEVGNHLYCPANSATPFMWDRRANTETSGTAEMHCVPWGHYPPMYPPVLTDDTPYTPAVTTKAPWLSGESFYYSVVFVDEYDSVSSYYLPQEIGPILDGSGTRPAGLCRHTVSGTVNSQGVKFITWSNIPIGPYGTKKRYLLRTPKTGSATTSEAPSIRQLQICAEIANNTQTSYVDYNGDDENLVPAPELVRSDVIWPWRGQYVFSNDSRIVVAGNLKPNPAAILIAPLGANANYDLNILDTESFGSAAVYCVEFEKNASNYRLKLHRNDGSLTTNEFLLNQNSRVTTVQELIDAVNTCSRARQAPSLPTCSMTVTAGDNLTQWCATLVPGADGNERADKLFVTEDGTNYIDTADNSPAAIPNGSIRAFGPTYPAILYFNHDLMDDLDARTQELMFTGAAPGHPPAAPRSFYIANKRSPDTKAVGRLMGGGAGRDSFIILYERGVYLLRNVRGGGTGQDEDYRLVPLTLSPDRGCCSWSSVVQMDGAVGWLAPVGFCVSDGSEIRVLSRAIWHADKARGEWSYEISESQKAASSNGEGTFCHATMFGDTLSVTYRQSSASPTAGNRRLVYDFSASHTAEGLAQLSRDGEPYPWSTPLRQGFGPMAQVVRASGPLRYAALDNTSLGTVYQFDTGTTDAPSATAITPQAYTPIDLMDSLRRKQAEKMISLTAKNGTGMSAVLTRATGDSYTVSIPSSSTEEFGIAHLDLPPGAKTAAEFFRLKIADDGSGSAATMWRIDLFYNHRQTER